MSKKASAQDWIIWGSELSPFALKLARLFRQAQLPFRFLPAQGQTLENWRYALRRERLVRGQLPLLWPSVGPEDEFPLVPFAFGPAGKNLYDSSAIAQWLDRQQAPENKLVPEDPAAAFLVHLIDEYADEWGLYLVHHQRWKVSARDNDAGPRLAHEFRFINWPFGRLMARHFAARQTRRLPYLFSVAPANFHIDGLAAARQPPSRPGFPATHALLEDSFQSLIQTLDYILKQRAFLFGERPTLADFSLYGQLGMNLSDPSTARIMQTQTPTLFAWLKVLHGCEGLRPRDTAAPVAIDATLAPLVAEIRRSFIPLMQQNQAACARLPSPQTHRNEAAFDRDQSLYDGSIDGHAFRAVAKSFQSKVWRKLCDDWHALSASQRKPLYALGLTAFDFERPDRTA
jgi:glutathione S-transferase